MAELFEERSRERRARFEDYHSEEDDYADEIEPFSFEAIVEKEGERATKSIFGFEVGEIREIGEVVGPCLKQLGRGRRGLAAIDTLAIFLCWASSGLTLDKISTFLKLSRTRISRNIKKFIKRSGDMLISRFIPQTIDSERSVIKFTNFPAAIGAVDATVVPICRPQDHARQVFFYDGKHHDHTFKFQLLVAPDGVALHRSKVVECKKHDKRLFDESGIIDFITFELQVRRATRLSRHAILADSGYTGITDSIPEAVVSLKNSPDRELTEDELAFNRSLASDRMIVENYFARMKTLFGIIAEDYRGDLFDLNELIQILVALTNFHISKHPLRG